MTRAKRTAILGLPILAGTVFLVMPFARGSAEVSSPGESPASPPVLSNATETAAPEPPHPPGR
jgi:hypothetical protein